MHRRFPQFAISLKIKRKASAELCHPQTQAEERPIQRRKSVGDITLCCVLVAVLVAQFHRRDSLSLLGSLILHIRLVVLP
jgi:hypothetical protein